MDANTTPTGRVDGAADDALSPAEMLALSEGQQRRYVRRMLSPIVALLIVWGVAWLVGFAVLWASRPDAPTPIAVPQVAGWITLAVLIGGAIVVSAIVGVRIGSGVRDGDDFAGAVYGMTWTVGSIAVAAIGIALQRAGMSGELSLLYWPAGYALLVGVLYLAGGALWKSVEQLVLGGWILVVGAVAPFFGQPANLLVMSIAGGGGFLVGAAVMAVALRRPGVTRG